MFFTCIVTFMAPFMMTIVTFQTERPVFLREQANKMYDVVPYYFAKTIAEIPVFTIIPLVFTAITYFMIGYNDSMEQFFKFVLTYMCNTLCAISLGYFMSSAFSHPDIAL